MYTATPGPTADSILLGLSVCKPVGLKVRAEETATRVVIYISGRSGSNNECSYTHQLDLEAPLAGRELVKGESGDPIPFFLR